MHRSLLPGLAPLVVLTSMLVLSGCLLDFSAFTVDADASACGNGSLDRGELCDPGIQSGITGSCPGPETCMTMATNPCDQMALSGSAGQCTAVCAKTTISDFIAGDQCCPANATFAEDTDCSENCGNGQVDSEEVCDDSSDKVCPQTADDCQEQSCMLASIEGDHCTRECTYVEVAPQNGDGCCPRGANSRSDNDCEPSCGNAITEEGEQCDPASPSGCPQSQADCNERYADRVCTRATFVSGGDDVCSNYCMTESIVTFEDGDGCCPEGGEGQDADCIGAVCGDSRVDPGEVCDTGAQSPFPCPAADDCMIVDDCRPVVLTGTGCGVQCEPREITTCVSGDSCCPSGCSFDTDTDCPQACGDGMVDPDNGEFCDGNCPSESDCEDPPLGQCASSTLVGDAAACTARCVTEPVTKCDAVESDNVCCAMSCNALNDVDCQPFCGNDVTEGDETCDSAESCEARAQECMAMADACTTAEISGSAGECNVGCTVTTITTPGPADGCCVADAMTPDPDCCEPGSPCCGNGDVEDGELCDGDCPTEAMCDGTFTGSAAQCDAKCTVSLIDGLLP